VVGGVAAAVQLVHAQQRHVVGLQPRHAGPRGGPQVHAVEAAAANVGQPLVAVGLGVPRPSAVLLPAQTLPHVQHAAGQAHLGHLPPGETSYTLRDTREREGCRFKW